MSNKVIDTIDGVEIYAVGDLHHRYPGQTEAQHCYVELDPERRRLSADWSSEIGSAVPFAVWHHRVLRFSIPALKPAAAEALLRDIAPLAARVCAGYTCVWNGSNHVGRYDDDAEDAQEAINDRCGRGDFDESDCVAVWEAADWLGGIGNEDRQRGELGITAATTDVELAAIVARVEAEAAGEGVDAIDGLERYLKRLREGAESEDVGDSEDDGSRDDETVPAEA